LVLMHVIDTARAAANDDTAVAQRERTVPIPSTITRVPGYPDKLCLYKKQASKYWQVRCWIAGRTYRRSTKTQNLHQAQSFARTVYEEWLAENYQSACGGAGAGQARAPHAPQVAAAVSFGTLAAQMFANEEGRVGRGEWSLGSLQVLRNRLDAYILPRWGAAPPSAVRYQSLLDFINFMSDRHSTTTISQYLVAIRKVLRHAVSSGHL